MSIPNTPIPEVKSSEIALHGFFDVRIDILQLPHGPKRPYYVVDIGIHAAAILAITKEGKLVITKEYRHPTKKWLLGCPGGRIDTGESPIEAAKSSRRYMANGKFGSTLDARAVAASWGGKLTPGWWLPHRYDALVIRA